MNRRLFLQSSAIIAAPAFVSATGIYRGVVGLIAPEPKLIIDTAYFFEHLAVYSERLGRSTFDVSKNIPMVDILTTMKNSGQIDMERLVYFEKTS